MSAEPTSASGSEDRGRRVAPWAGLSALQIEASEVTDLIRRADEHRLGREFLLEGAQGSVAATFGVHAFLVDAARAHLGNGA